MTEDLDFFYDSTGQIRRCGSLLPPKGMVSAFATFEAEHPVWNDGDIRRALTDPNRKLGRKLFGPGWVQNQGPFGCHDDKTEVLTERGWVAWTDYNWVDPIGTTNPVDGFLEFQTPTEKHVYPYDGELYHSTNRNLSMALTPNHRMLVRKWSEAKRTLSSDYTFCEMQDIGWYAGLPAAASGWRGVDLERVSINGDREFLGDDFVAMVALVVSDGWVGSGESKNRLSFCCFRDDRYEKVNALAHRIGLKEIPGRKGVWGKAMKPVADWVKSNCYTGQPYRAPNKRIPAIIKTLSRRQILLFLDFFGDKTHGKTEGRSYYTSSRVMADDIQELLLRVGMRSSVRTSKPKEPGYINGRPVQTRETAYVVSEWTSDSLSIERKKYVETDRYRGDVFCATVPNGTIVTRRDGTMLISGNSCNGYALAGALSKARWLRGITDTLLLSGSFAYSLMNQGRDGGSNLEDGLRVVQKYGCPPESLVTYDMIYPNRQPAIAKAEAAKHRGLQCYAVQTKQGFRTAVAAGFPVIVAVSAGRGFQTLNNRGIAGVDNGSGNHAVMVDDAVILDDGREVYDHQNSWGTGYGQQGRSYLTWEHFAQTFGNHVFYAIPSTTEVGL